ncbi:MAG: 8-oxo-dGTP diphosphatase MutT [Eubacteriales bacterium]
MKVIIEVTAAIIKNDKNEFLICQRPGGKNCEYLWEFPGGKQEPDETLEMCLIREIKEELNIEIDVRRKYDDCSHEYNDSVIHITFFDCFIKAGKITAKEHNDIKWVPVNELNNYQFCPADGEIVRKLVITKL